MWGRGGGGGGLLFHETSCHIMLRHEFYCFQKTITEYYAMFNENIKNGVDIIFKWNEDREEQQARWPQVWQNS